VQVSRANADSRELIDQRMVQLQAGHAVERFHLFRPGSYRVQVSGTNGFPDSADVSVQFSATYVLSAAAALLAALLMLRTSKLRFWPSASRILLGLLFGVTLTFLSIYGKHVTTALPFPSFGDEPTVNAVVAGFVGGLLNPYLVTAALVRWASGIALHHHRPSEPAKA
jgi:O-antigen ligase